MTVYSPRVFCLCINVLSFLCPLILDSHWKTCLHWIPKPHKYPEFACPLQDTIKTLSRQWSAYYGKWPSLFALSQWFVDIFRGPAFEVTLGLTFVLFIFLWFDYIYFISLLSMMSVLNGYLLINSQRENKLSCFHY